MVSKNRLSNHSHYSSHLIPSILFLINYTNMFEDSEFPPNLSSLGTPQINTKFSDNIIKSITWRRISQIYSKPVEVFHKIDPNDIQQGNLGDCYLLSAISALAEFPDRVKKLFYTKETSETGQYKIGVYHNGIWTIYEIDDFFPCIGNSIAFSGPRFEDGVIEIWVVLLEKVWAKRYGGYFNIENGYTEQVLHDLTGAPCEKLLTKEAGVWEVLSEANEKHYIITGSIDDSLALNNVIGLVTLHAYAVIHTQTYKEERLLKLRNPWGKHEFLGDWSDFSEKWTEDSKAALGWQGQNDGIFWMNFEDFCKYFSSVTICRAHDSFKYHWISTYASCFKVSVFGKGNAYFSLTQNVSAPVRIVVGDANGHIIGKSGLGKNVWVNVECNFNDYFVYTERNDYGSAVTFSVYTESNAAIEEISESGILQKMWSPEVCKNKSICKKKEIDKGVFAYECEMVGLNGRDFYEEMVYDVIENCWENQKAIVEVSVQENENVTVLGRLNMVLEPKTFGVVIFKHTDLFQEFKLKVEARVKLFPVINSK